MKLLIKDTIFDYQPSKKSNKLEFTDLYLYEIQSIAAKGLINLYQYKVCRNWMLRLSFDGSLPTTKVGKESDIDIVERVDLFHNSEIDDNSNNNE